MQVLKNMQQDKTSTQLHRKGCGYQIGELVTAEKKSLRTYSNVDKSFLPWYW